jgi:hypothetical protein
MKTNQPVHSTGSEAGSGAGTVSNLSKTKNQKPRHIMKNNLLLTLATVLGATASASADVVVYKGTARAAADLTSMQSYPKVIGEYIVVDYTTREIGLIQFGGVGAGKGYNAGVPGTIHITSAPIALGKTATVLSVSNAYDTNPTDYRDTVFLFRGTNASVTTATIPAVTLRNLPRILTGSGLQAEANGATGQFVNQTFTLLVDAKKTVEANNAKRSVNQTLVAIVTELKAKGYTGN